MSPEELRLLARWVEQGYDARTLVQAREVAAKARAEADRLEAKSIRQVALDEHSRMFKLAEQEPTVKHSPGCPRNHSPLSYCTC